MTARDPAAVVREAVEIAREGLRYPRNDHHNRCATKADEGCDCYARFHLHHHQALDSILAALNALEQQLRQANMNRDQWHSAANEEGERAEDSEAEVMRLTNEVKRLAAGSEIPALRLMVENQAETIQELERKLDRSERCLADVRAILDAYSDDDGPGASLVALGKIGQRVYSEATGV